MSHSPLQLATLTSPSKVLPLAPRRLSAVRAAYLALDISHDTPYGGRVQHERAHFAAILLLGRRVVHNRTEYALSYPHADERVFVCLAIASSEGADEFLLSCPL